MGFVASWRRQKKESVDLKISINTVQLEEIGHKRFLEMSSLGTCETISGGWTKGELESQRETGEGERECGRRNIWRSNACKFPKYGERYIYL